MPLSIGSAFMLVVAVSVILERRLFVWSSGRARSSSEWRVVRAFGIGGALLAVVPAFLASIVVGGNLGGGLGELLLGIVGVPIGLAAGIVVVFSFCLIASTGAGLLLGKAVSLGLSHVRQG